MVHLSDLSLTLDYVTERALADAYNLHLGGHGVDGLLVENWEERSDNPFVTERTVNRMLYIAGEFVRWCPLSPPFRAVVRAPRP
jgi:predicted TIM-barrel enzyme